MRGLFCKRALSKRLYSAKETYECFGSYDPRTSIISKVSCGSFCRDGERGALICKTALLASFQKSPTNTSTLNNLHVNHWQYTQHKTTTKIRTALLASFQKSPTNTSTLDNLQKPLAVYTTQNKNENQDSPTCIISKEPYKHRILEPLKPKLLAVYTTPKSTKTKIRTARCLYC